MPAVERVLQLYNVPLKDYILSIKKCPTVLDNFFDCPNSKIWRFLSCEKYTTNFISSILKYVRGNEPRLI